MMLIQYHILGTPKVIWSVFYGPRLCHTGSGDRSGRLLEYFTREFVHEMQRLLTASITWVQGVGGLENPGGFWVTS